MCIRDRANTEFDANYYSWGGARISHILRNPFYKGAHLVFRTHQKGIRSNTYDIIPRDQWEVIEDVYKIQGAGETGKRRSCGGSQLRRCGSTEGSQPFLPGCRGGSALLGSRGNAHWRVKGGSHYRVKDEVPWRVEGSRPIGSRVKRLVHPAPPSNGAAFLR